MNSAENPNQSLRSSIGGNLTAGRFNEVKQTVEEQQPASADPAATPDPTAAPAAPAATPATPD